MSQAGTLRQTILGTLDRIRHGRVYLILNCALFRPARSHKSPRNVAAGSTLALRIDLASTFRSQAPRQPRFMLLGGIKRRAERLRDSLAEVRFVQRGILDAGGCNHFGLVNRDVGNCKALDY